jgi:transcription elongation factor Elf1
MKQLKAEEIMDVNILFAMTKCMGEIAHGLQYIHTQKVKQKIKHVIKTVDLYEREIDKKLERDGSPEAVESIYDSIMDLILEAKVVALKNYNDGNTNSNEKENNDSSS